MLTCILIFTSLKIAKVLELWFIFLWLVMAWENKSIDRESIFSLQCSGSTSSLPLKIDSLFFLQGLRIGFSIALPLQRVITDLTWSCVSFLSCPHFSVLSFCILLWLIRKFTFLLTTKSKYEFFKSFFFQICNSLSILSIDWLFLFNEWMQCFLKISFRRETIKRYIYLRTFKIMMCLKGWLWSLCIIVITLLLLLLFQLKFGWFLQLWLYVYEYGLGFYLWKLFKTLTCSWRHSMKDGKNRQLLVECSLVSHIWYTTSWTNFN